MRCCEYGRWFFVKGCSFANLLIAWIELLDTIVYTLRERERERANMRGIEYSGKLDKGLASTDVKKLERFLMNLK